MTDVVSGEVACESCGLVLIERGEDMEQETATYSLGDFLTKSRTGAGFSLAMHDKGLYTNIGSQNVDATGKPLSGTMKNTIERLRKWDQHSKSRRVNRSLVPALSIFDSIRIKLSIPSSVIEEAAYIYRKALSAKLTKGRNSNAMACAALYAACRKYDIPRTLRDISDAGNIRRKVLSRTYRVLITNLDLKLRPFDSTEFITRISNEVGISEKTRRGALVMISKLTDLGISAGKNPMSIAAAVLFLSCVLNGEKKSQIDIAKSAGITTVTIRNRIQGLRKEFEM
ncbi:MAG TPA: transcription initiation factor IIB [Candidatus Nitrosotalea sp.]|nr:transcription initiation factor IIB [Candidatus Nitrosotalea sp.]